MSRNETNYLILVHVRTIDGAPVAQIAELDPYITLTEDFATGLASLKAEQNDVQHRRDTKPFTTAILALLRDPNVVAEFETHNGSDKENILQVLTDAYDKKRQIDPWTPPERWRSKRKDENARDFIERVYMTLAYEDRPYTHQLSHHRTGDKPLYDAFTMIVANNRRLARAGEPGTIGGARHISDIFPMIGTGRGPKRQITKKDIEKFLKRTRRNDPR